MEIDQFLHAAGGVATRAGLVGAVGRHRFDNLVKSGHLTAVFPRVYARPWDADLAGVRRAAAPQPRRDSATRATPCRVTERT
jgi:hypothetical protein